MLNPPGLVCNKAFSPKKGELSPAVTIYAGVIFLVAQGRYGDLPLHKNLI